MNDIKCEDCKFYDPIIGPREKVTRRGWCSKRSEYPHKEGRGQVFPFGVKRVGPEELAKPFIVRKDQVVEQCRLVSLKTSTKKARS